jgi:hypothetical protein
MKTRKSSKKVSFVEQVTAVLEGALALSHAFERLLVDVVAAFVPWLAPVIPAYLAFHSLYYVLHLPLWVSIIGALVVEFLGMATVATVVQFNEFNLVREDEDPSAPLWPAVLTATFYLAVILTVNVVLDNAEIIQKVAKGLMSSLSIVGAVTISLRGQHRRRVEIKIERDMKEEKERQKKEAEALAYKHKAAEERRKEKLELKKLELQLAEKKTEPAKVSVKVSETEPQHPETFGKWKHWTKVPKDERMKISGMTDVRQVMDTYGVSERTGYNWMRDVRSEMVVELQKASNQLSVSSNQTGG